MRTYERTHPWLKFQWSLHLETKDWLALGEAKSKCEHICTVPLHPIVSEQLARTYIVKGARASAAIEGNTLTEEQVAEQLDNRLSVPPSKEDQKREIENILHVLKEITPAALRGERRRLAPDMLKDFNRQLLAGLPREWEYVPGEYAEKQVGVSTYRGAPPEDIEYLIERLCAWLNDDEFMNTNDENRIPIAVLRAIVAHVYIAWIHAFGDGNGRTARLVEYTILLSGGVPEPSAHLLSNHYNATRKDYYRHLDHASKSGGDLMPFVSYAIEGFREGLREQIQWIKAQHSMMTWESYVHSHFGERANRESAARQCEIVLNLMPEEGTAKADIPSLSPTLARLYAGRTPKTLSRDINQLLEMELIAETSPGHYRASMERLSPFMPKSAVSPKF